MSMILMVFKKKGGGNEKVLELGTAVVIKVI